MKKRLLYITFHTSAEAMATEEAFKAEGLDGKLAPVPRALSAGCGVAWKTEILDKERIIELLEEKRIEWDKMEIL